MSVRVFVPVSRADLQTLVTERRLPGPRLAHALTDALREAWPGVDQEEGEYAALMAAAAASRALGSAEEGRRRRVLAVDAPDAVPTGSEDPTEVRIVGDVAWRDVAAAHVDLADDAAEDDDLAWFATQEIPDLG
ncbi:MAG TPA: hypothetical protein PLP61_03850 [Nocardioides sp.]|uniref:DUF6912 family protein n=1 Tax=Nocardioides sp. TaxID=35761 RepID=UPI002C23A287|nr:hypothetical protein [Nocardioides sp.]HQR26155.1 hypothetical protein [Nocardioides sp.]